MNETKGQNRASSKLSGEEDPLEEKLEAYLAEYHSLRTEMEWLIKGADQYQNFTIALIGASVTILPWIQDKTPSILIPTLLILPVLFSLLGLLYLRQHEEVYVIAAYLSEYIRPRVRHLVKDNGAWGWEEFKAQRSKEAFSSGPLGFLSTSKIIVILRSSLFLFPSFAALIVIMIGLDFQNLFQSLTHRLVLNTLMGIWFLCDVLIVLLLIFRLWSQGDLAARILKLNTNLEMADATEISAGQASQELLSSKPGTIEKTSIRPT
jgi:hypothetical protein